MTTRREYEAMSMKDQVRLYNTNTTIARELSGDVDGRIYKPLVNTEGHPGRFPSLKAGAEKLWRLDLAIAALRRRPRKQENTKVATDTAPKLIVNSQIARVLKELEFKKDAEAHTADSALYTHDQKGTLVTTSGANWTYTNKHGKKIEGRSWKDMEVAIKEGRAPAPKEPPAAKEPAAAKAPAGQPAAAGP